MARCSIETLKALVPEVAIRHRFENASVIYSEDQCCATVEDSTRVTVEACLGRPREIGRVEGEIVLEGIPYVTTRVEEGVYEMEENEEWEEKEGGVWGILPDENNCRVTDAHLHEEYGAGEENTHVHFGCSRVKEPPRFRKFVLDLLQLGREEQEAYRAGRARR